MRALVPGGRSCMSRVESVDSCQDMASIHVPTKKDEAIVLVEQ